MTQHQFNTALESLRQSPEFQALAEPYQAIQTAQLFEALPGFLPALRKAELGVFAQQYPQFALAEYASVQDAAETLPELRAAMDTESVARLIGAFPEQFPKWGALPMTEVMARLHEVLTDHPEAAAVLPDDLPTFVSAAYGWLHPMIEQGEIPSYELDELWTLRYGTAFPWEELPSSVGEELPSSEEESSNG